MLPTRCYIAATVQFDPSQNASTVAFGLPALMVEPHVVVDELFTVARVPAWLEPHEGSAEKATAGSCNIFLTITP